MRINFAVLLRIRVRQLNKDYLTISKMSKLKKVKIQYKTNLQRNLKSKHSSYFSKKCT